MDKRYQVRLEFCGYATPRYVLRFCDDFLAQFESLTECKAFMIYHASTR